MRRAGRPAASSDFPRWHDRACAFTEADAAESCALALRAQDHGVPVVEERPALAVRQLQWFLSVLRELQQRTALLRRWTGDRPRAKQITRLQVAAVHGVMRNELRD